MSEVLCGGHCCEKFYTRLTPIEWERYARASRESKRYFRLDNGNTQEVHASQDRDIQYIAAMIIPLPRERGEVYTTSRLRAQFPYTCKHFDPLSRLCKAYAERPRMCSEYPEYGKDGKCNYEGCQCSS